MNRSVVIVGMMVILLLEGSDCLSVHGRIASDTTWSDIVHVDGDVIVTEDVTLTICARTRVQFSSGTPAWDTVGGIQNRCDLIIKGKLRLLTSVSDSVFFNSTSDSGGWGCIALGTGTTDTIEYAGIERAKIGIRCHSSSPLIRNCLISNSDGCDTNIGIYSWESSPEIVGNTISDIRGCDGAPGIRGGPGYGIRCVHSSASISGNCIVSCMGGESYDSPGHSGYGIYSDTSTLVISNNVIESCVGKDASCFYPSMPCVAGNGIGIYCRSCTAEISGNTIHACKGGRPWGTPLGGSSGIGISFDFSYSFRSGISRNVIYDCQGVGADYYPGKSVGICCRYSSPRIAENYIHDCHPSLPGGLYIAGIYCESASPEIVRNRIYNNCSQSWSARTYCNILIRADSDPLIGGSPDCQNDIHNPRPYNVVNLTGNDIIATHNWWGDTCRDSIATYIYDHSDDSTRGYVIYDPWASDSLMPAVEEGTNRQLAISNGQLSVSPNPFTGSTVISYQVPVGTRSIVPLQIHDAAGRLVKTLISEKREPGRHEVTWNAGRLPTGIYFVRLAVGKDHRETKKLILVR